MLKSFQLRSMIKKLVGSSDDPGTVARGFAVGVFVAFSPFVGFHGAMVILLAFLFRGNRIAAFISSTFICNPITLLPVLYIDFRLGKLVLGLETFFPENLHTLKDILQAGSQVVWPLFVGGHLIGLVLALLCLPLAYFIFIWLRWSKRSMKLKFK